MDNYEAFLEFAKELSVRAHKIGTLETELRMKDSIIAGLTAQLAFATSTSSTCSCGKTSDEKLKNHVKAVDIPKIEDLSDVILTTGKITTNSEELEKLYPMESNSISEEVSKLEEPVKKKGRPKGSKNGVHSTSAKKLETSSENKLPGGTVFKDFVPLDKANLLGKNTSAYIPTAEIEKSPTVVLSAV